MIATSTRNAWLRLDDAALLKQCDEERYRASGPGGQRRNKVETAVRLRHRASGAVSQAEEARSLEENRRRAVHRLRLRIALHVRASFDLASPQLPAELPAHRSAEGALTVSLKNDAYPMVVAAVLDALQAAGGSYAVAAHALGVTTSQLLRCLRRDREVWRALSEGATAAG